MKKFSYSAEELYNLLPEYIRQQDSKSGGFFLQDLLEIIAEQVNKMENNIENLYNNWFIETCDEWVVPYIGDLLGIKGYYSNVENVKLSQRALIANTTKYRQSKGATSILENLSRDVTGWTALMIEFFKLLNVTKNMNYLDTGNKGTTVDLKNMEALDSLNTPFNTISHNVEIKDIGNGLGFYNIKNVGIFLWRLTSFPVYNSHAFNFGHGRYSFSQLGHDIQLFNNAKIVDNYNDTGNEIAPTQSNIKSIILEGEHNFISVGQRILITGFLQGSPADKRSEIAIIDSIHIVDDIQHIRYTKITFKNNLSNDFDIKTIKIKINTNIVYNTNAKKPKQVKVDTPISLDILKQYLQYFYAKDGSKSIRITVDNIDKSLDDIVVCDLSEWKSPNLETNQIAIDPTVGRILFPSGIEPKKVRVWYYYGFSKNMGGGFYLRPQTNQYLNNKNINLIDDHGNKQDTYIPNYYFIFKSDNAESSSAFIPDNNYYSSITSAIKKWEKDGKHDVTFIILDSELYYEDIEIILNSDTNITITAYQYQRPIIKGSIRIIASNGGNIVLDGLIIDSYDPLQIKEVFGSIGSVYKKGSLNSLTLSHCTIVPRIDKSIGIDGGNDKLVIVLDNTISGSIEICNSNAIIKIKDSIVDGQKILTYDKNSKKVKYEYIKDICDNANAIQCYRISEITNSTIFGSVNASMLDLASNSIFTDKLEIKRLQTGCIRFCYIPEGSNVPHMHECQQDKLIVNGSNNNNTNSKDKTIDIKPIFTSQNYGEYGYAQLDSNNPPEILEGADNKSEMGAFNSLFLLQKEKILKSIIKEYTKAGIEAGIFTVT